MNKFLSENIGSILYLKIYTLLDLETCSTWEEVYQDISWLYSEYVECPQSELSADGLILRNKLSHIKNSF